MFDVTESIEEGYLWNFSSAEKSRFIRQHQSRQSSYYKYNAKLAAMVATDEPAIFENDEPRPSTPLEIKYTLNRIHMNDPRETELLLNQNDPVADKKNPYAETIPWAFEDNTYCQTVVLNGARTADGWRSRGFNDAEAVQILDVLSDKKLTEFTFSSYPLLTDRTYQKIADILGNPDNHWAHVTLGKISVDEKIADSYQKSGKVSFVRIAEPQKSPFRSFLSSLLSRERIS